MNLLPFGPFGVVDSSELPADRGNLLRSAGWSLESTTLFRSIWRPTPKETRSMPWRAFFSLKQTDTFYELKYTFENAVPFMTEKFGFLKTRASAMNSPIITFQTFHRSSFLS